MPPFFCLERSESALNIEIHTVWSRNACVIR